MFAISDSWLITFLSEFTTTWNQLVSHSPATKPWGFTRVFGMLKTGLQEVVLWKRTGHKLLSLPLTETSTPMLVFGQPAAFSPRLVPPILCSRQIGRIRVLMLLAETGSDGCKTSSWFTITALTSNASLRVYRQNARDQGSSKTDFSHKLC